MKKLILLLSLAVFPVAANAVNLSSIFGTTWTFDAPAEMRVTVDGDYTYYGYAKVGTKSAATGWIIMRLDTSGNIEWAQAAENFSLIFTSAATYTYTEGM